MRGDQHVAVDDPRDGEKSFAGGIDVHHHLARRRSPHRGDLVAALRRQRLEPLQVRRFRKQRHLAPPDPRRQLARRPGADVRRLERHPARQRVALRQRPSPHVVAARPQLAQQADERRLHIEEVIRVAADVGLAAALAPVGEDDAFGGVRCTVQPGPRQRPIDPPLHLRRKGVDEVLVAARGALARDHDRFDASVTLGIDHCRCQRGMKTRGRSGKLDAVQAVVMHRGENGHAEAPHLFVAGLAIAQVQRRAHEKQRIDRRASLTHKGAQDGIRSIRQRDRVVAAALDGTHQLIDVRLVLLLVGREIEVQANR